MRIHVSERNSVSPPPGSSLRSGRYLITAYIKTRAATAALILVGNRI